MLMGAGAGLHDAGDDGGAAGGADGSRGECAGKEHTLSDEIVDGRGITGIDGIAVATHVRGKVFGENPENIRTTHIGGSGDADRDYTEEEA